MYAHARDNNVLLFFLINFIEVSIDIILKEKRNAVLLN
jgi:hypothetical protein